MSFCAIQLETRYNTSEICYKCNQEILTKRCIVIFNYDFILIHTDSMNLNMEK